MRFNLLNLSNKYVFENRYLSEKFKKNKIFKNKKITYQYINHYNDENKKVKKNNKYIIFELLIIQKKITIYY